MCDPWSSPPCKLADTVSARSARRHAPDADAPRRPEAEPVRRTLSTNSPRFTLTVCSWFALVAHTLTKCTAA